MNKIISTILNPPLQQSTPCAMNECSGLTDGIVFGLLYKGNWTENVHKGEFAPICLKCAESAGYISTDSLLAKQFGFNSTQYSGYLWMQEKTISINTLSVPLSQKKYEAELFYDLFCRIIMNGYNLRLMNESAVMEKVAAVFGYKKCTGTDPYLNKPYKYLEITMLSNKQP